jgi:AraC-like DNA-binding protein
MEHVVEQVLDTVRKQLGRQYTLDELARIAMFSKFHFARMFRRVTGVSPRRFLYALRLQEAKRLLVTTSLSVADVSHRVGYSSVGTFTTRFTASIGVPPAVYRRLQGNVTSVLQEEPADLAAPGVITGRLEAGHGANPDVPVVVGLFRRPMPDGPPARCDLVSGAGDWSFRNIPCGRWYVLAVSSSHCTDGGHCAEQQQVMMSMTGPVKLCPDDPAAHVTLRLRPMRPVDPPILVPLTGLPYRRHRTPPAGERPRQPHALHRPVTPRPVAQTTPSDP